MELQKRFPEESDTTSQKNKFILLFEKLKKIILEKKYGKIITATIVFILILALTGSILYVKKADLLKKLSNTQNSAGKKLPPHDFFSGFLKMAFETESKDEFKLKAEKEDALGVSADSAYILESKEALGEGAVKEHLKMEPDVSYALQKLSDTSWKILPEKILPPSTLLKVSLANLASSGQMYSWAYQVKDNFKVLNSIPREQGTYVPVDSGVEITFTYDNFKDWQNYFEMSPSVAGSFEHHGRTLVFVPQEKLAFKTLYTVKIKKGMPLVGSGETLAEEYTFSFETEQVRDAMDRASQLNIYDQTLETTADQPPVIQVSVGTFAESLDVAVFRFSSWREYMTALSQRDKLPWWSFAKEQFKLDTTSLSKLNSLNLPIKTNADKKYIELPTPLTEGFYLAELSHGDAKVQVWIQVSDLTAYYNITKTQTLVWANSAKSKKAIAGAEVELVGTDKRFATSEEGVAKFSTPSEILAYAQEENTQKENFYFKISKGDSVVITPASQVLRSTWWNKPEAADDYWRYFYTDRPRYQTTDTIKYWGLVKARTGDKVKDKVTVTLYKEGYVDYYYHPVSITEQEISLSQFDTFEGEIKIADLRPDYYTLEIKVGDKLIQRKYLSIKAYTKPAFDLSLTPDKKVFFAGDTVNLKLKANFFEGTPVPNLKLILKTPEGDQKVTTNEDGEAQLTYSKEYTDCTKDYSCWPSYQNLNVVPENSELSEITAEMDLRAYGARTYARSEVTYPKAGEAQIKMQVRFIDLEKLAQDGNYYNQNIGDAPANGVKVEGKIIRTTYEKNETGTQYDFINKKTYKTYNYAKVEEEVGNFSNSTDKNGRYVFSQAVVPETSYQIKYRVYDREGHYDNYSQYLYYYNGKFVSQYSNWDYRYYRLELSDTDFSLGDEVKAIFKKNDEAMPEVKGRYLFMQLQNGLRNYTLSDKPEYSFQFSREDIPDVNLSAVYFNGVTYDAVADSYSGEQARYRYSDSELNLNVTPDKKSYRPGEDVTLSVKLKNKKDTPVEAEVNLNLVDEAYYAVADDKATPLDTLYASVGSGILLAGKTHYNSMLASMGAEKGGCFAAGTLISMADGSEKPIEKVQKGDKVLTLSDPLEKAIVQGEVTDTWRHVVAEYLIINHNLKVTPEHQMFSNGRFTDAGLLKEGDWLLNLKGEKVKINSITYDHEIIPVYNLRIDPQHTFFAGGFYVHNEEKGGGPREFFTDAALFKVVRTNSQGEAKVTFKLPDNLTSWRITSQAISREMEAGVSTTKLPVSLPVFADVTIGNQYLLADKPVARLRAYGTALNSKDKVAFTVSAPTLSLEKSAQLFAQAFAGAYFPLPDLKLGRHEINYSLESAKGKDAIKLPLEVVSSRMEAQSAKTEKLSLETKVEALNKLPLAVVLSDLGANKLYQPLQELSWSYGDRIDQKYVSKEARNLLGSYYQEETFAPNFRPSDYQLTTGGISLLPYSSDDLDLSARVASSGAKGFDQESLAQYFFKILEHKNSTPEEISPALFGLAELRQPVLPRIYSWLNYDGIDAKGKLQLAQALFDLGDETRARQIYYEVLGQYGQKKAPQMLIRASEDLDQVFEATALASVLSACLETPEADGLFDYVVSNQLLYGKYKNSENLFNLEKLNFLSRRLTQVKPSPAGVSYELDGQKKEIKLTDSSYSFQLPSEMADKVKFTAVTGDVGISTRYTLPLDPATVEKDKDISLKREYLVNGEVTDHFSQNDMVEVRLYPNFYTNAILGDYQITDILPSGLAPVTRTYDPSGKTDCHTWYPYDTDGQMVKYRIDRYWDRNYCGGDFIRYYARVKTLGTYRAENAIIQSSVNPDYINYSSDQTITISQE